MKSAIPDTVDHFILAQQQTQSRASGEFSQLLSDIIAASKIIAAHIRRAGLTSTQGAVGGTNVSGDQVQKLDMFAHHTFLDVLGRSGRFAAYTSEESDEMILSPTSGGKYIIHLDPLDGSSNIDVNVSVGTIFSIYRRPTATGKLTTRRLLMPGTRQVCSGYVLYGSSVMLVYTTGHGVHGFTLDADIGEFFLSHPHLTFPSECTYYSINEGYADRWNNTMTSAINQYKKDGKKARYIGSLVADFHRNLLKGGIFIYPADAKNPQGKLRLLYEANPMAFLAEQAGGAATNGQQRILDITPTSIHQRVPLFIGHKAETKKLTTRLTTSKQDHP